MKSPASHSYKPDSCNAEYVVVGAGFFGSVLAERIAQVLNKRVLVIDRRSHIGGNSHSEIDPETGIECHKYGSHIFHTESEKVWEYLKTFTSFNSYQHKVFIEYNGKVYTMPINLKTVNDYYGVSLKPYELTSFLAAESRRDRIANPHNFEEKAISLIGRKLYEAFIKGYTIKQWNRDPKELPESILSRLPIRTSYNNNYFSDRYQGIPTNGYYSLFNRLLSHPNIEIRLKTSPSDIQDDIHSAYCVIYTGMLDELFDYQLGVLGWRSLRFEWSTHAVPDFQGTTVMNYGNSEIPHTRIHEFKHYHPERKTVFALNKTITCKEFPADYLIGQDAYYPITTPDNLRVYHMYLDMFSKTYPKWIVGGRLGAYQYWDMDKAVFEALVTFERLRKG